MISMGNRIKKSRLAKGLTQVQLGELLGMGRANVGHLENDRVIPTSEALDKIADILGTTTDYLLCRTNDPNNQRTTDSTEHLSGDYRKIERFARKVSTKDLKKAVKILDAAFEDAFKDDDEEYGDDI